MCAPQPGRTAAVTEPPELLPTGDSLLPAACASPRPPLGPCSPGRAWGFEGVVCPEGRAGGGTLRAELGGFSSSLRARCFCAPDPRVMATRGSVAARMSLVGARRALARGKEVLGRAAESPSFPLSFLPCPHTWVAFTSIPQGCNRAGPAGGCALRAPQPQEQWPADSRRLTSFALTCSSGTWCPGSSAQQLWLLISNAPLQLLQFISAHKNSHLPA